MRERRSLWGSISTSEKVNRCSWKAALLYTWAIPHFDDEGFQEGTPKALKHNVVPYREDIPLSDIKNLILELVFEKLWDVFHINSTAYIYDPVFFERQPMGGIHRIPSKIKKLLGDTPKTEFNITATRVAQHTPLCISEVKLSEVKRSEVKRSTTQNPISLSSKDEEKKKREREEIDRKVQLYKEKESRI